MKLVSTFWLEKEYFEWLNKKTNFVIYSGYVAFMIPFRLYHIKNTILTVCTYFFSVLYL